MFLLVAGFLVILFPSCNKDKNLTHLSVQMTDAPGNFGAVYIDLQGVEIKGNGGNLVLLNANEGIYNLLDFSNGADTLIASGDLEAGEVSQMRLILGSDNTVMVDGVIYPLSTPSAMQSGLKLQMHHTFEAGVSKFYDASITYMFHNPDAGLNIIGYTDSKGSDEYNKALGLRRAQSVKDYFEGKGIPMQKLTIESKGEKEPAEDNSTDDGRAKNRRATVTIKN